MKNKNVKGKVNEGWSELPPINRDRYGERQGLEGPFQTRSGKVVYYDPREGAYYDPDSDIYLTYGEWRALDESLPPHLARHVDKDGNKIDGEWVAGKWRPKKKIQPARDVTPKGYGPDDTTEAREIVTRDIGTISKKQPGRIMRSVREKEQELRSKHIVEGVVTNYLLTPRVNGSSDQSSWSVMQYSYQPDRSHPLHLRKLLDQHAKELGWDQYDVFAQWNGDIDSAMQSAQDMADRYESRKAEWPTQYYDNKKKAEKLKAARELMATTPEAEGGIEEARDPHYAIRKFLDDKKAHEERMLKRGERLRKERDARLAQDKGEIEEKYKPKGKRRPTQKDWYHMLAQDGYSIDPDGIEQDTVGDPGYESTVNILNFTVFDPEGNDIGTGEMGDYFGTMHIDLHTGQSVTIDNANHPLARDAWSILNQDTNKSQLKEYKPGVTVLTREISFNDFEGHKGEEDYQTVKKIRWPYGIDVSFDDRNRTVRFKTAKMKTVAKILGKHIDFDSLSAGEVLDLPVELMASAYAGPTRKQVNQYAKDKKAEKEWYAKHKAKKDAEYDSWVKAGRPKTNEAGLGTGMKAFQKASHNNKDPRMMKFKLMLSSPEFIQSIAKDPEGKPSLGDRVFAKMMKALGIPAEGELQRRIAKKLVASGEYKKAVSPKYSMMAYSDDEIKDLYNRYIVKGENPRDDLSLDDVYPMVKRAFGNAKLSGIGWTDDRNVSVKDMDGKTWVFDPVTKKKTVQEAEVGDKVKYRNIKSKRNKTGTVRKVDTKNGQKRYELDGGRIVYNQDLEEKMAVGEAGADDSKYEMRAKDIRKLNNFGTYRVTVANFNNTNQDPVQAQAVNMYDKLRGLGYDKAAEDWLAHYQSLEEKVTLGEAPAVIPFASEFKTLIKRFQTEIDWDNVSQEKEGGTTIIIGSKNGKEYFINFAHPRKKGTMLITGWWFVDVVVGNMYLGKKYFAKSGNEVEGRLSHSLKPIEHIRAYKEMVSDGTIEANLAEAERALQKLKAYLNDDKELEEATVGFGQARSGPNPTTSTRVVVAKKGRPVKEFNIERNAQPHHVAQSLRQAGLGLSDHEIMDAARKIANGEIFRKGDLAMQAQSVRPREMESVQEDDDPCWDDYRQLGTKKKNGREVPNCVPKESTEVTLDEGQDFHEEYGYLGFADVFEAEYQGRKVTLNKPVRSSNGPKKFHVYVKDGDKVKKVNFGDPNMEIKADNPDRRKSFRARHNCDNPGPKTKARYWSCKKW